MKVLLGHEQAAARKYGGYRQMIEKFYYGQWGKDIAPLVWAIGDVPPVVAIVAGSNWIAECPDCGAHSVVTPLEGYCCPNCGNMAVGHQARPVTWPADRAGIEAVLLKRPAPETRNWLPHETIATLEAENAEKGL